MLNNRKRNVKNITKSYTDINNYNNFLLELDKNSKKNEEHTINHNDSIQDIISQINNKYHNLNYSNRHFNGNDILESIINNINKDPNIYEAPSKSKSISPKSKLEAEIKMTPIIKKTIDINVEINNIQDLLSLIELYPDDKETKYNINMEILHKIKEPLTSLNNMIGMNSLKENIVDQLLFYIQNLHTLNAKGHQSGNDFMHTVIYGPPGTGKTEIAKIMGDIFSKIGILNKGTFRKVTRSDLIAGYLGQTALKTRDVIKDCLGGVLFIDEAYALGNNEKRDSFSKECIDTLCEALSDHKDNLMVIIAGYETDLNECFFTYNQGLHSRFTWRFKTDDYSAEDLYKIFLKKIMDGGWTLAEESKIEIKWFEKNKSKFKFYGRDIETLFAKTKIAHSRRVFCLDDSFKKKLTIEDIDKGLEVYLKNEDTKSKKDEESLKRIISTMYM